MSDIYPARVAIADGVTYKVARVRTSNVEDRLQVWIKSKQYPHKPVCVVDQPIAETIRSYNKWAPRRDRHAEWLLADGTRLVAMTLAGCGCGDPLRHVPPWTVNTQQTVGV